MGSIIGHEIDYCYFTYTVASPFTGMPLVTKMGSIIGHEIDYNGIGPWEAYGKYPNTRQKLTQVTPPPPSQIWL